MDCTSSLFKYELFPVVRRIDSLFKNKGILLMSISVTKNKTVVTENIISAALCILFSGRNLTFAFNNNDKMES